MNKNTFQAGLMLGIVLSMLVFLTVISLAFTAGLQHTGFNGLYVNGQGLGTATPAVIIDSRGLPMVLRVNKTPVAEFSSNGVSLSNQSLFLRYQDVAAAPSIVAETGYLTTTAAITSGEFLGVETPRNLQITYISTSGVGGPPITTTAGSLVVTGVDARGNSTTETLSALAISGTQSITGNIAWKSVTTITLPTRTESLSVTVTGGQKFGLPLLPGAVSDLYHLTVAGTPQTAPTVSTTYGTFDPVSTPAANIDYNVWVKQ
jgi:hypothetical protein